MTGKWCLGFRLVIAGIALLGCIAGCGESGADEDGEPAVNVPSQVNPLTLVLPLDSYVGSDEETHTADRAKVLLFLRCMRRYGFEYDAPDLGVGPYKRNERRYGITTADRARAHGYHAPEAVQRSEQGRATEPVLSDAALAVAEGVGSGGGVPSDVPRGGCHGEAKRQAVGAFGSVDFKLPERLSSQAFAKSKQDSRVQKAFQDWSRCMTAKGFAYDNPDAAMNDRRFKTESPTEAEKDVALADFTCKDESSLTRIWVAVETAYQQRFVEKNSQALDAILHAREALKGSWAQIVAGTK